MSMQLNDPQRAAVRATEQPCLVLAGAGSGKTRVITAKIAHLIENGFEAKQIVALTFTNKAALEMKERADALLKDKGLSARGLTVSTFHSLGVKLLRSEAQNLGLKPGFSILDATDAFSILQNLLNSTDKKMIWSVANQISLWKNALLEPEAALNAAHDDDILQAARAYLSYDATLRAYQAVDFDDLIRLPVKLLQQ
ncbi:MAG: UvrD-helicase domain-containing protein, partial [Burkholderiales bacterium]